MSRLTAGLPALEGTGGSNGAAHGSESGQVWGEEDVVIPRSRLLGSQLRCHLNLTPEPAGHGETRSRKSRINPGTGDDVTGSPEAEGLME